MANSPSITLIEQDSSSYPVTTSETVLAIVGYATNGPIGDPTLVSSRNEFIRTFGNPPADAPWSHLAAYRAFNQSNQIYFNRIGDTGDSVVVKAERVIDGVAAGADDGGDSWKVQIQAKYYGSYNNALKFVVSFEQDPTGDTGVYKYKIEMYLSSNLRETFEDVSLTSGDTNFFETIMNRTIDNGGSGLVAIDTYSSSGDSDFTGMTGDSAGVTYLIGDSDGGDTIEKASGDSWTQSNYLTGDSGYDFVIGTDGVNSEGDSAIHVAVLSTSAPLSNTELYDYHILITPDDGSAVTQNAAITMVAARGDCIYIADPPQSASYTTARDWHNGLGSGRSTAINNSYAATYWPWLKEFNIFTGQYVWCPPSVFVAEKYMEIDRLYGPWYAPAGDVRGKIIASDYETSPSKAERDVLYGGLNAVNPIVYFNQKGLEIFGQKTLLRSTSALNRVNVRRMVIYAKKLIKSSMDGMIFEPHNADSWTRATNIINSILEPIRQDNGLEDYRVTIDSTTNGTTEIANNTMKGIIKLLPYGTIEIIELTIQLFSPGASITD